MKHLSWPVRAAAVLLVTVLLPVILAAGCVAAFVFTVAVLTRAAVIAAREILHRKAHTAWEHGDHEHAPLSAEEKALWLNITSKLRSEKAGER